MFDEEEYEGFEEDEWKEEQRGYLVMATQFSILELLQENCRTKGCCATPCTVRRISKGETNLVC